MAISINSSDGNITYSVFTDDIVLSVVGDKLVALCACYGTTVTGVAIVGGSSFTAAGSYTNGSENYTAWRLDSPPSGSQTIRITVASDASSFAWGVYDLTGTISGGQLDFDYAYTNTTTSVTQTVTTSNGGISLSVTMSPDTGAVTATGDQSLDDSGDYFAIGHVLCTDSSDTHTWSGPEGDWMLTVVSFEAAGVPTLTDCEDEDIAESETGVLLDGTNLTGGTPVLEIGNNADYESCTVKSTQTINSNNGTQIDFDVVLGSLSYGSNWLYLTNSAGRSAGYAINLYADNTISSAASTVSIYDNVTVSGGKFGAAQSSSKLYLCDQADALGTNVEQTIISYGDTSITFRVVKGSLSYGTVYIVVGRNNSTRGDSAERLSNGYSTTLAQKTRITYRQIVENGGGTVARLWHVAGYPWAVTDSQALIDALEDTDDAVVQAFRKRLFGSNEWTDGATTVTPAYSVPIFPTLINNFGRIKYEHDESNGLLKGGRWSVKVEDRNLGHTWDHAASGDSIWGLEGLHRTPRVKESSVHGWGYLEKNLLKESNGSAPSSAEIYEQSNSKIFSRIAALSEGEWLTLWVNHEAVAIDGKSGTYPKFEVTFADTGSLNEWGRGLYRSRFQNHFLSSIAGLDPIIADVPGSIIGGFCWLYSIPLNDGALMLTSDDEPLIVEEMRGVISPNVSTERGITTIQIREDFSAIQKTHNIDISRNLERSLGGFVFSRGNSGTSVTSVEQNWQMPHLVIYEYNGGPDGDFLWNTEHAVDGAYFKEQYIWICPKNSTVVFDTAAQVMDALNEELTKLMSGDPTAYSWPDDGEIGSSSLFQKYKVVPEKYNNEILRYRLIPWIVIDNEIRYTANGDKQYIAPFITGPLAWVFSLGRPHNTDGINLYTKLNTNPKAYYELETYNDQTMPHRDEDWPFQSENWMVTDYQYNDYINAMIIDEPTELSVSTETESSFGSMIPNYYYSWDWENNIQDPRDNVTIIPPQTTAFRIPNSPYDNIERLFFPEGTDVNSYAVGDTIFFGRQGGRFPLMTAVISSIDDDLTWTNLVSLRLQSGVIDTTTVEDTFPIGTSLFYLQNCELWGNTYSSDNYLDPHFVGKRLSIGDNKLSDIFKTMLGENAISGMGISKELQDTECPFFLDERDFISAINWDQLDEIGRIPGQYYRYNIKERDNLLNIFKQELLMHRCIMTRYFDDSDLMWKYGFKKVAPLNVSIAANSGYLLNADKAQDNSPVEGHGNSDLYNRVKFAIKSNSGVESTYIFENQNASIVGPDATRTLEISPIISTFPSGKIGFRGKIIDLTAFTRSSIQKEFFTFLQAISFPCVVHEKKITLMQYLFPLGKEIIVSDETAHVPYTHALNLDNYPAMIIGYEWDLAKNDGKLSYRLGGSGESFVRGIAPACYLTSGNFSKDVGSWEGTPDDHYFTSSEQPKDAFFFDCYNFVDPTAPTARTTCGCGDYSVYAIEVGTYNWTPLPFTCEVDSTGYMTLTGTTTNIDTAKDYIIIFQGYDSLETCQQVWAFHSDDNNTIGTSGIPAIRWV